LEDHRGGQPCRLNDEQLASMRARIAAGPKESDGVCSLRGQDLQRIIREEYGLGYSLDGVYYLLHHHLGQSYVKPRPRHRKAKVEDQAFFKKKGWTSIWSSSRSTSTTRARRSKSGSPTRAASASKVP
jgi:transposase